MLLLVRGGEIKAKDIFKMNKKHNTLKLKLKLILE